MSQNDMHRQHPQPAPEVVSMILLEFARRAYELGAFESERPLWSSRLRLPNMGSSVFVEVTPSLQLRIRDYESGEVLVQSMPADFNTVDTDAPMLEELFRVWREHCERQRRDPIVTTEGGGA